MTTDDTKELEALKRRGFSCVLYVMMPRSWFSNRSKHDVIGRFKSLENVPKILGTQILEL